MTPPATPGRPGPSIGLTALVIVIIAGLVLSFVSTLVVGGNGSSKATDIADAEAAAEAELLSSMAIPPFEAVDQDGRARTRTIFETRLPGGGRYTVLNFIFTRCVTVCPITTGHMIRVQQAILDLPGFSRVTEHAGKFQLVSLSVDPERDTPESLRAHAAPFADFGVWTFLTADDATVTNIVEKGLGFALEPEKGSRIDLGDGRTMENIIHPSKLLLISPEGRVIGMYRGLDEADVDRLITRIQRLNRER